jgi:hypothetical protein
LRPCRQGLRDVFIDALDLSLLASQTHRSETVALCFRNAALDAGSV